MIDRFQIKFSIVINDIFFFSFTVVYRFKIFQTRDSTVYIISIINVSESLNIHQVLNGIYYNAQL